MTTERAGKSGRVALVTGGSRGLGRALVERLARDGWSVITDGRDAGRLAAAAHSIGTGTVEAVAGDVADPRHRDALAAAVHRAGRLDLLVNNASLLGPSPMPALADYDESDLRAVVEANALAPLALMQLTRAALAESGGRVVNITSDAAVEAYPGWGGYGASKAALEHLTAVWAAEEPGTPVYAFDPGDMATEMHQAAFPGEDISDRPGPEEVVPDLLALVEGDLPSGRYAVGSLTRAETG